MSELANQIVDDSVDVDDDEAASTSRGGGGDEQQPAEADSNIRIFLRIKPSKKPSGFFTWDEEVSEMKYNIPKDVAQGLINNSRTSYKCATRARDAAASQVRVGAVSAQERYLGTGKLFLCGCEENNIDDSADQQQLFFAIKYSQLG